MITASLKTFGACLVLAAAAMGCERATQHANRQAGTQGDNSASKPATQAAPAGLTLDLFPLMSECPPSSLGMVAVYRLTNTSTEPYSARMPYKWYGLVWDWFDVYHDGRRLRNRLAGKDYSFDKVTVLAPGESVTIAFRLTTVAELPRAPKARLGRYEVRARKITDEAQPHRPIHVRGPATFVVVESPRRPVPDRVETEDDFAKVKEMVGNRHLSVAVRSVAVWRIASSKYHPRLWEIVENCDEPYLVASFLEGLPRKWADKPSLLKLLQSKDLTVRREAVRAIGDRTAAGHLRRFLKTQKDEVTLDYGRKALELLENKRPPVPVSTGLKVAKVNNETRTIDGKTHHLMAIADLYRSPTYDGHMISIVQPHKPVRDPRWVMRYQDAPAGIYLYWVALGPKGMLEIRHGKLYLDSPLPESHIKKLIAQFPILRFNPDEIPTVEGLSLDHLGQTMKALPAVLQSAASTAPALRHKTPVAQEDTATRRARLWAAGAGAALLAAAVVISLVTSRRARRRRRLRRNDRRRGKNNESITDASD